MGAEKSEADTLNVELASMLCELPHPYDMLSAAASLEAEGKHYGGWGDALFLSFSHERSSTSHSKYDYIEQCLRSPTK